MANWTQRKLVYTIGGAAAALCLAAGGGIYWTQGVIDEVRLGIEAKEAEVAKADARIRQIPALERDVIILRENLGEYVKILPDDKELTDFLRMLNQFNRQSGVKSSSLVNKQRGAAKSADRFTPIEYSYEMTATLWQAVKFMNLVENFERFVSITDFSIDSGAGSDKEQTRDGDVVHQFKLTLQTYSYNGKVDGKEAHIPDYQNLKEQLREEIWKRMQAIRIDRYEHRGEMGRRDVLVDPRERGDANAPGPTQEEQREVLERNLGEIARLRDIQQRIKRQDTTLFEQYSLEKSLKEGLDTLAAQVEADAPVVTYPPFRLRWAREVVAQLEDLRGAASDKEGAPKDPYLGEAELRQLVADMAADCNSGQLEQAKTRYELVGARLAVPADDARHELAVAAKTWHVKATTALDFKALDLKVQGVVVNPEGRSGVLLNGETFEEGEYVSDDLLVKLVEEEQIWFVFRGLTLVRTM
jgi:Tfp pilus assembly protein PilO